MTDTTDGGAPVVAPVMARGSLIAGRYRLDSRLGSGGGGTVWRCTDDKLHTVVAIKLVRPEGDVERWRREVAMARQITDRNVCRVHDLGDTPGVRFVTMELVEGTNLRDRIGALSAADAFAMLAQIASGTAAIHAAGVVHRDLKPENIVVATDGRVVIVDFGLARTPHTTIRDAVTLDERSPSPPTAPEITSHGVAVGTPRYMSPEQAAGDPVDARSDVFALGLLGHELACGALPGTGELGDRTVRANIEPRLAAVLRRCLATTPGDRYPDAREVVAALAHTPSAPHRRRLVVPAAVIGAGAIAGVVAAAWPSSPSLPVRPDPGPFRLAQLTSTQAGWPGTSVMSVALAADASQLAYTTGDGKLFVQSLAGGIARELVVPADGDGRSRFVTSWAAGVFADGAIAELGSTRRGDWQLLRVTGTGEPEVVYRSPQRFTASVATTGDIAIGADDYAIFVIHPGPDHTPRQLVTIGRGEQVMSIAWSPDGKRLAVARMPADSHAQAIVQVMSSTGVDSHEVWRGDTSLIVDTLLAWLDDDRLVFSFQDPASRKTSLATIEVASSTTVLRDTVDGYAGIGAAGRGVVVQLRGTAPYSVQVGDHRADKLVPVHDAGVQASQLAGWTSDGQVVFAMGQPGGMQIVRARPGESPVAWPGTTAGVDRADSIVDDNLIAHHARGSGIVVERISPTGERQHLVDSESGDASVRCAADRTAPCAIIETRDNSVEVTALDPGAGGRGPVIHRRQVRERYMRDAALSSNGEQLAIVDGGDQVSVIDVKTGAQQRPLSAKAGAALQSVSFAGDGDLWVTSIGFEGRLFGLMTFDWMTSTQRLFSSPNRRGSSRDSMRWYWRATPSLDGTHVAVCVREFHLDVWRIDGL